MSCNLKIKIATPFGLAMTGEGMFRTFEIWILDLSFDLAQDGELTEPFRASDFEFRILK